jgi:alkylhydroperoxidase/carboxymuconolactone decarboxylase family protein YurZ
LFSKKGVFPPHQRLAHACALSSVILRKPTGISKHAAEIAPIIAAATARENNDDVLAAMLALCVQVSAYAGFFEDASAKAIKSAMLHISAAVRQSLWRALLQCSEKYSAALLSPFIPHFQAAIESAVTKPAFRGDGAAALAIVSNLSISESAAEAALKAICGQVLKRVGFLADLLENFPSPYEVEAAVQASESLLLRNTSGVDLSACMPVLLQAVAFA